MRDSCAPRPPSCHEPATRAQALHLDIARAVLTQRRSTREIALGLALLQREGLHRHLGYASLVEYGQQCFDFCPSKTRQLLRVGRLLPDLPLLDRALANGELGWTKLRTLCQVVTPTTQQAWLERAKRITSRQLEDQVADARRGDLPPESQDLLEPPRYVWARFRLDVFHFERLMQALAELRHELGDPDISASQLLLILAERYLDQPESKHAHVCSPLDHERSVPPEPDPALPSPDSRPPSCGENTYPINYRIIEHRCPDCQRAWTEGRAGKVELDESTRAMVECDAEVVAGDDSAAAPPGHITRTIPPATRRAVLVRDGGRCQVPGCSHTRHLELHHIEPRSAGGDHKPDNLVTLCWTHHDLVHRDVVRVRRAEGGQLAWERGGGEPLGVLVSIWRDRAELDHGYLEELEGAPGSWSCIQGYWGELSSPLDDAAGPSRVPKGFQRFVLGDDQGGAPVWMGLRVPGAADPPN
jgi:hypothetical protein